jgi:putative nucleotidyltransferase-like protein
MVLTAEIRWMLACLRSVEGEPALPPPPTLDWNRALAIAETEGLAPALGWVFKAAPAAMPPAVRERLSRHLAESTAGQLILSRELVRLLEAFDRQNVPVIPLKGPALAEALYPHPGLRPCRDLDLLIRRQALVTVDGLLQGLGYRRLADDHSWSFDVAYDRATLYEGPRGVRVDLHWSLVSDPRFAWDEADGLTVWERAVKQPLDGGQALGLCPEDLLLYLAVHLAVHHGLTGLLWYWDLARLLGRTADGLDWETVVARSSRWRVRTVLYFVLLGCERLFGVSAPAAVLSRLRARGPRAAALGWLVRHHEADRLRRLEHLIALLLVDHARDLIRPLRSVVLPSPAWVRARYGDAGPSLLGHYLAHWRRLAAITRGTRAALARGQAIAPDRR